MSLNPTSSHGGGLPLSGGTLTGGLTVALGADATALEVDANAAQLADLIVIKDASGNTIGRLDASNNLTLDMRYGGGSIALKGGGAGAAESRLLLEDKIQSYVPAAQPWEMLLRAGASVALYDQNANVLLSVADGKGVTTRQGITGALATTTFVSGTGKQIDVNADRELLIPFTGDASNNAATLKLELSPDNVTYSTLDTLSIAAALNLTGALNVPATLHVAAAWYVKLTATHGTIGTCTYY